MQKYFLFMISININLEETAPLSLNHKIHLLGQCIPHPGQCTKQCTIASKMWDIFFNSMFVICDCDYSAIKTPEKVPET